jgi:cytochrome c553
MSFRLALVVAIAATTSVAQATGLPKADMAKGKQLAGQVCAACHATDGNSTIAQNPVLAGQSAEYLYRQLVAFKGDANKKAERPNAVMASPVANLSNEDMASLAVFYAAQKPKPRSARNKELAPLGQQIYRGGIADRGVPACAGCHGATGAGVPVQYPRLAGQHAEYTEAQMKLWRTGERANDQNRMMRMISAKMTDREIQAVSDYIAGLR